MPRQLTKGRHGSSRENGSAGQLATAVDSTARDARPFEAPTKLRDTIRVRVRVRGLVDLMQELKLPPTERERFQILQLYTRKVPLDPLLQVLKKITNKRIFKHAKFSLTNKKSARPRY